jgi:hypothetical protein
VSTASPFAPKQPRWFATSAISMVAATLAYVLWAWWVPWRAGRPGGLTFGTIGAAIFFIDGLYPLRRRLALWPLGTAQRWLQFHIYGGAVAMLCVLIHVGFSWPRGGAGWWLLGLSAWTTVSGLFGVLLQKWIPTVIAGTLRVEALASRIPELAARCAAEADSVMSDAPERSRAAYRSDIRPWLERPQPAWGYVSNTHAGRRRHRRWLDALDRSVDDRQRVEALRAIVARKAELDAHLSLQRALRAWLLLHVPAAVLLLGLLAVHVFAAIYF